MSDFGDLIPEFIEESLEHLKNIEEDIIIIEQGTADNELINRVFRAVHSIKGGSSFLGLKNIERLSHKMEDLFNLVRNNELVFTSEISSYVLKSIDKLKDMLEDSEDSDNYDIEENLRELKKCLEHKPVDKIAEKMKEDIDEASVKIDKVKFESLRKQGKKVFLIQFELMDESLGGKNPLDFFNELEKTGEILVRNVDMELVLKDDSFTGEGIPLSILYASVLERDLVAHIFGIDEKSVKEVRPDSLIEEEVIEDAHIKDEGKKKGYLPDVNSYFREDESNEPPTAPAGKMYDDDSPVRAESKDGEITFINANGDNGSNDEFKVRDVDARKSDDVKVERIQEEVAVVEEDPEAIEDLFDLDDDADTIRENNEYLTFLVGEEEYGIGITQVHEIVTLHDITPLPGAEVYTKGVINLRGDIIPVYDFRLRLKFEERQYDNETIILIVMINNKKLGVIVDRVSEVIQFNRDQITDAPQMQQIPSDYVIGIGQKNEKFIILLKLKEIFKAGEAA
jgi:chemotaxis signal transduction protein/HPt (histidine-containing phosphotransfer) domain-containing protein